MKVETDGVELFVSETGTGEETVVFSHSFLVDQRQFESQIDALRGSFRVIAYDHRGHGDSDKPVQPYDLQRLVDDAIAVIEATHAAPCHWVGLSTGGFVGMRIALQRPELLKSLVLMDTSADEEPALARAKYEALFIALGLLGWGRIVGRVMTIMFGKSFMKAPARQMERDLWRKRFLATKHIDALHTFSQAIFGRDRVVGRLGEIDVPTLVMVGEEDTATTPEKAQRIARAIPDAELVLIPEAGHLSTVCNPDAVNSALSGFLQGV